MIGAKASVGIAVVKRIKERNDDDEQMRTM